MPFVDWAVFCAPVFDPAAWRAALAEGFAWTRVGGYQAGRAKV